MRFAFLITLSLFALVPLALAQDVTPTPTPAPTLTLEAPDLTDGTQEPLRNFDLPLYLSGVGATPISDNVNIRSGPGTEYRIIGVLRAGRSIDVVGHNGYDLSRSCVGVDFEDTLDMWITVQFNEQRGWIARCTVTITGDMSRLLVHPAP